MKILNPQSTTLPRFDCLVAQKLYKGTRAGMLAWVTGDVGRELQAARVSKICRPPSGHLQMQGGYSSIPPRNAERSSGVIRPSQHSPLLERVALRSSTGHRLASVRIVVALLERTIPCIICKFALNQQEGQRQNISGRETLDTARSPGRDCMLFSKPFSC